MDEPSSPFGPGPDRIEVTYTAPARATFGELGWQDPDPATTEKQVEAASTFLDGLLDKRNVYFDPEIIGPSGMLFLSAECVCGHYIINHLAGHCDVCPCERSTAEMAVKLNIEE